MKRPLTGLVVAYSLGILVGQQSGWSLLWLSGGAGALLVIFLVACRTRWSLVPLLAAVFCTGMWAYRLSTINSAPHHIAHLLQCRDQNLALRGVIISDPGYREAEGADNEPSGDRHSFKLELQALNRSGEWEPATGCVLVFISTNRQQTPLRYGNQIECSAILRVPPPARNPGTFDWQRWLARQNIQFTATIRKIDDCKILVAVRGNPIIALSLRLRERIERALHVGLEDQPRLAGVFAGMVIGERSEIPEDTYANFQQTGVFHVFAINGLHVGMVTAIVVIVLRLMRVPRRWTAVPAIPLLILYVFATGAHPGAVRALVMVCIWLIGGMLVRPVDLLSSLALAAFVILIWCPSQLFDGGFILSFTVVLALVILTDRSSWWKLLVNPSASAEKECWWMSLLRPDPLLPRELIPRWRRMLLRPILWLILLGSGSLAAWLGLLPLLAVYFHLFTPISIVANLVVIPMLGCVLAVGLASVLACPLWPAVTLALNNANFFLLSMLTKMVDWFSHLRWGHCFVQAPPLWLTISYYMLLILFISPQIGRKVKLFIGGAVVVICALILMGRDAETIEVTVLDLHDGAAIFVNLPGENHDYLIDGGGDWSGERVVLPFLRGQGVDRLEALVLTRGDKAHAAGLTVVAQHVPIRQVIHTGTGSRSKYFWDWLEAARRIGLDIETVREGDDRVIAGLRLHALNPPTGQTSTRSDDNALVLMLEYGETRMLLTSDIGQSTEQRLLANGADLKAQILVKGRHSDEPSGTDAFLDSVKPAVVIQAVATRPSDRYFEPGLRERLRNRKMTLYRTDETGAVTIHLTKTGYTIQTCLATEGRLGKEL